MNLFTEIQYLFYSIEHEKMLHSVRMEKLRELTQKAQREFYEQGIKDGILKAKKHLEKL